MSLLLRIITLNTLCLLVVIVFGVLAGNYLFDTQRKTSSTHQISGLESLWTKSLSVQREKFAETGKAISRDRSFKKALGKKDADALQEGIESSYNLLSSLKLVDSIFVADGKGNILASAPIKSPMSLANDAQYLKSIKDNKPSLGITSLQGGICVRYISPIAKRGKILGTVIYCQKIGALLSQVAAPSSAHGIIVANNDRVVAQYILPDQKEAQEDQGGHQSIMDYSGFDIAWLKNVGRHMPSQIGLLGRTFRTTRLPLYSETRAEIGAVLLFRLFGKLNG